MRILSTIIVLTTAIFSTTNLCGAAEKEMTPVIELKDTMYRFERVNEGDVVTHDFKVFNRGDAVLEITKVEPG
jgi:hypothetical protein